MAEELGNILDRAAEAYGFKFRNKLGDPIFGPDYRDRLKQLEAVTKAAALLRQAEARKELLGGVALAGTDATPEERAAFVPGRGVQTPLAEPTAGLAEGTVDPALAGELAGELRAEELNRTAARNAPALATVQQQLRLKDAGFDLNNLALARLHGAQADTADLRRQAVERIANDPNADPLLVADLAQGKPMFKPQRVKVRHTDGREVYYDATPRLAGGYDYTPAVDAAGQPLRVPASASGDRPTALQKNAAFIASTMFAGDEDGELKAVEMLTRLKAKSPTEAWAALTKEVSKMNYGRYARDPQRLYEKTAELWRVSRPMEPLPVAAPGPAPAPTAPAGGAKPSAPVVNEPTAVNRQTGERLVFRNGQWQPLK